jgi:Rap1a immunity proteins
MKAIFLSALSAGYVFCSSGALAANPFVAEKTGNWLLEICTKPEDDKYFWSCAMYIDGVVESDTTGRICFPSGVNNKQIRDVILANLKGKPHNRHEKAWVLITLTLGTAFPCPTKEPTR